LHVHDSLDLLFCQLKSEIPDKYYLHINQIMCFKLILYSSLLNKIFYKYQFLELNVLFKMDRKTESGAEKFDACVTTGIATASPLHCS